MQAICRMPVYRPRHDGCVQIDDFFAPTGIDEWFNQVDQPRMDVIRNLMAGPLPDDDDLETAIALTRLVHAELEEFGTKNEVQRLDNDQIAVAQRSLRVVLARHDISLNLPWRDYSTFRSHWINEGASGAGGWQARREILGRFFDSVFAELDRLEDARFVATLADPVSPAAGTGWAAVDSAVNDVRARFRSAATPADYSDVGRRCIAVMEALSATVYDPDEHLRDGETEPPVAKTHMRITRFVEDALGGSENVEVRALVRKAAELAEAVKHRSNANRRDAGIAADAAILLANILRRVDTTSISETRRYDSDIEQRH